jgi:muramoyltetrapeptide carboxypeptidase LdcA involved in peptidoglycan recycling
MIRPKKLRAGDKVMTLSSSWGGPGAIPYRYEIGKQQLQDEFGLEVVEAEHTFRDDVWLKRNPQARADDLMAAFADPSVKGIISTIGGADSIRLLPYLDLQVIRDNPKVYMGYSDTTVTLMACFKAGLVSFYGPAIMSGFAENGGMFPYMVDAVRRTLFSSAPIGRVPENRDGWTVEFLTWEDPENQSRKRVLNPSTGWIYLQGQGTHRGHLIGGCFVVLDWLRGTPVWPEPERWQNAILFLETAEDGPPPTVVMGRLRSLAAIGILAELSGILLGRPGGQVPPQRFGDYDDVLLQVVAEEEGLTELPIITRMDFGHTDPMMVLPYGVQAEIDCDTQTFAILESAVVD